MRLIHCIWLGRRFWQQFLKILKVEKSLILRAFRGVKSDLKFKFYEEQKI